MTRTALQGNPNMNKCPVVLTWDDIKGKKKIKKILLVFNKKEGNGHGRPFCANAALYSWWPRA